MAKQVEQPKSWGEEHDYSCHTNSTRNKCVYGKNSFWFDRVVRPVTRHSLNLGPKVVKHICIIFIKEFKGGHVAGACCGPMLRAHVVGACYRHRLQVQAWVAGEGCRWRLQTWIASASCRHRLQAQARVAGEGCRWRLQTWIASASCMHRLQAWLEFFY